MTNSRGNAARQAVFAAIALMAALCVIVAAIIVNQANAVPKPSREPAPAGPPDTSRFLLPPGATRVTIANTSPVGNPADAVSVDIDTDDIDQWTTRLNATHSSKHPTICDVFDGQGPQKSPIELRAHYAGGEVVTLTSECDTTNGTLHSMDATKILMEAFTQGRVLALTSDSSKHAVWPRVTITGKNEIEVRTSCDAEITVTEHAWGIAVLAVTRSSQAECRPATQKATTRMTLTPSVTTIRDAVTGLSAADH